MEDLKPDLKPDVSRDRDFGPMAPPGASLHTRPASGRMSVLRDVVMAALTVFMLVTTYLLYDNQKPLLDYMEYLPVYRVEQLWERRDAGE